MIVHHLYCCKALFVVGLNVEEMSLRTVLFIVKKLIIIHIGKV